MPLKFMLFNPLLSWMKWSLIASYYEWKFRHNRLSIGSNAKIINSVFGTNISIYRRAVIFKVNVGDYSYVASDSHVSRATIGKFCSIGSEVLIGLGQHPIREFGSTHPAFYSLRSQAGDSFVSQQHFDEYSKINIGNDVWIGTRVMILDGVNIADGVIVGAGALVINDIPPYAIVGGVPAKILGYRFEAEQIETLLKYKWWDKDANWLKNNAVAFQNIEMLLTVLKRGGI